MIILKSHNQWLQVITAESWRSKVRAATAWQAALDELQAHQCSEGIDAESGMRYSPTTEAKDSEAESERKSTTDSMAEMVVGHWWRYSMRYGWMHSNPDGTHGDKTTLAAAIQTAKSVHVDHNHGDSSSDSVQSRVLPRHKSKKYTGCSFFYRWDYSIYYRNNNNNNNAETAVIKIEK